MNTIYKICFYVPEKNLNDVKTAMFQAGAGKIGSYDSCCWETKGQSQFRALEGSKPHLGQQDQIEIIEEYKVELVCAKEHIKGVMQAFKQAHPYEMPAYHVTEILNI